MAKTSFIKEIIKKRHLNQPPGIFSICSANSYVLRACMQVAKSSNIPLLIESTCNQVNQYGGYMNLKPNEYVRYIKSIAQESEFPFEKIILGGDHLGPSVWRDEPSDSAMQKSTELVRQYVRAGFKKIHLDASMSCADDLASLPTETIAEREAQLCKAAKIENDHLGREICDLCFVVGTEVPTPGGSSSDQEDIKVSSVEETEENIFYTKKAFLENGLTAEWENILAFVVQPGVEFSDNHIYPYDRKKAKDLSKLIENYDNLIYEAHSTDYQTRLCLKQMVSDHFSILKVGPALTFALREALFALNDIEIDLIDERIDLLSDFKCVLDKAMILHPGFWEKYFSDDPQTQYLQRKYSLLDRSRYFLNQPEVEKSIMLLTNNLMKRNIPLSLVSQYFPDMVRKIKENKIKCDPYDFIRERIKDVVDCYICACDDRIPESGII